jgi:hypothetical protein
MRRRLAVLVLTLAAQMAAAAPHPVPRPPAFRAPAVELPTGPAPHPRPAGTTRPAPQPAGAVCGDGRLAGRALAPVVGPGGCGVANPVRLRAVSGVALTPATDIDCETARALADWVETALQPAARSKAGVPVGSLKIAAGYACRRVNNRPAGRLSQHALGKAVDIAGFTLSDGRTVTLLEDWNGAHGPLLRAVWRGACGPFGTVLGPEADRWHADHFHFDTARYRSGPYCR